MLTNQWRSRPRGALLCAAAFLGAITAAGPCSAQAGATNGVGTQFELTFWESVAGSNDPSLYDAYLEKYPDGTFAALARAKASSLRKAAAPVPAPVAPVPAVTPVVRPMQASPALVPVSLVVPSSPPAPTPIAAAPAPVLAMATTTQAPVAGAAQAASDAAGGASPLGRLLEELRRSQESSPAPTATYTAPNATVTPPAVLSPPLALGFAMPARPQLAAVPAVALPPSFCSAEERNAFHDGTYQPAVETAKRNNDAAVAYMTQLRSIYNTYQADSDPNTMNALAAEAREYQPLARAAFDAQGGLVSQFNALMAVPIHACGSSK